jgi:hypothetical protein
MAITELVPVTISRDSVALPETASDETDGHFFYNDGRTILWIKDTAATPTITIYTPGTVDGLAVTDRTIVIVNSATIGIFVGPFPPSIYNYSDGSCRLITSAEATCTYGCFRIPAA